MTTPAGTDRGSGMRTAERERTRGSAATRETLLRLLKEWGRATANQIGKALGISKVAVHHHLRALGEGGWVSYRTVKGRRGRPAEVFFLTQKAEESLFPKRYDQLAKVVLDCVHSDLGDDYVREVFRKHRQILFASFLNSTEPLEDKVRALAHYLDREGYLVKFEEKEDGFLLNLHNCPIAVVAKAYPQACAAELEMLETIAGTPVERPCHQAQGDHCCTYFIPKENVSKEEN